MIDASAGFMKDGPKNRLRDMDIHKIVDTFAKHQDVPKYARMVGFVEIEKNDFNLNLPRYIDSQTLEDAQDIAGHLQGGIPVADVDALQSYWAICPKLRKSLFTPNRSGYVDLAAEKSVIQAKIHAHPEFAAFTSGMNAHFTAWREQRQLWLKRLKAGCHPKQVISELAEDLLAHYQDQPLINPYDVYQHLMDYWAEVMQDDVYAIAAEGWKAEIYRIIEKTKKGEKDKGWACDLLPKSLIVARYFATEQKTIDDLVTKLETIEANVVELEEEHGGEEGFFADLDKLDKANITARLKEIKRDKLAKYEAKALNDWLKLTSDKAELKKALKETEAALDAKAYAKYAKLPESEIKALVVEDKWLAILEAAIHGEMDRINQALTQRVKELAERYETPLPELAASVVALEKKVNRHLVKMGFSW